ncbi:isochorismate synthase [Pseudonocardia sp. TRM90224]|uniref:isochorismate synthase n=1 Tax=Pseudonocardia sp. TRM90224 TaxID=2812678 RepID=UPI001E444E1E|nr:isochorismate synthase [Pseudonocardia sp. TRM90224]
MTFTAAAAATVDELLARYAEGAAFFSSRHRSLLGEGVVSRLDGPAPASWAAAAGAALESAPADGDGDAVLLGVFGFAPQTPARLVVPRSVHRAGPVRAEPGRPLPPVTAGGEWDVRSRPEPERFEAGVQAVLDGIAAGDLEKVVLARSLEITAPGPVDAAALLRRLAAGNPRGHIFAVDVTRPEDSAPRTLVGASPELLVARSGRTVTVNPLAGTARRALDPTADRAVGTALARSAKDRHEHTIVVDEVRRALRPYCTELHVPDEPLLIRTPALWHLSTRIVATLRDPTTSSVALAQALHPTPAVGGMPRAAALEAIREVEGFDRDHYTGVVGWCDRSGDGEWAVVLRCAEVVGATVRLFAGGGVVAGSVPSVELAESRAKFRTLLAALDVRAEP